ncbi:MAG: CdaR family protein [Candidatus Firestonebacteria bacterium]
MLLKNYDLKILTNIIKGWFTNNKTIKILALLIAIVFWVYIAKDSNSKITVDVDLQVSIPSDSNFVIVGDIIKNITLTLWGPNDTVRGIIPSKIKVFLDIKNPEKGEKIFVLGSKNVFLPDKKIIILDIEPKTIKLNFQKFK